MRRHCLFTTSLLLCAATITMTSFAQTLPAGAERRLTVGKMPGTFHYEQQVQVTYTAEAEPVIKVSFRRSADNLVVTESEVLVKDDLTLAGDFSPGTYRVILEPIRSNARLPDYELGGIADFHIDKQGVVHYLYGRQGSVQFVQRVAGMRPGKSAVADDVQPVLRWDPVAGAAYYVVSWVNGDLPM
ncbi:MAG TPA: hypothetical protein VK797_14235, partial [Tepidisphaeraceae bacterium]|nr:hypothetical protein [Tepidisphaeraceae bacterium]